LIFYILREGLGWAIAVVFSFAKDLVVVNKLSRVLKVFGESFEVVQCFHFQLSCLIAENVSSVFIDFIVISWRLPAVFHLVLVDFPDNFV
jgi:hypothetical protein